eukprot:4461809-Pleurochrysis_carterae.AAC.1
MGMVYVGRCLFPTEQVVAAHLIEMYGKKLINAPYQDAEYEGEVRAAAGSPGRVPCGAEPRRRLFLRNRG